MAKVRVIAPPGMSRRGAVRAASKALQATGKHMQKIGRMIGRAKIAKGKSP